ncbi:MTH1187 family thiamine-binding protein [Salinispora oceanensis]|uniref:MTH1187 family thiamine-binding protein n=1 Tax=Salinispora oceanensis TaxID=1050199 RepID=UPI00036FA899|nr:MTH1187 family thiamine-binding protein [Salinispora oceanensis]
MPVLVAFSVTPLGVGEDIGELVAEAVRVVRESGLPNHTDAMFTLVEGETWDQVFEVIKNAVDAVAVRSPRVSTVIKMDYHQYKSSAITARMDAVERYLASGHEEKSSAR